MEGRACADTDGKDRRVNVAMGFSIKEESIGPSPIQLQLWDRNSKDIKKVSRSASLSIIDNVRVRISWLDVLYPYKTLPFLLTSLRYPKLPSRHQHRPCREIPDSEPSPRRTTGLQVAVSSVLTTTNLLNADHGSLFRS